MNFTSFFSLPGLKFKYPQLITNKFLNRSRVSQKYIEQKEKELSHKDFAFIIKSISFIDKCNDMANPLSAIENSFAPQEVSSLLTILSDLSAPNHSIGIHDYKLYLPYDFFNIYQHYRYLGDEQRKVLYSNDLNTVHKFLTNSGVENKDKIQYIEFLSHASHFSSAELANLWLDLIEKDSSMGSALAGLIMQSKSFSECITNWDDCTVSSFLKLNPTQFATELIKNYAPDFVEYGKNYTSIVYTDKRAMDTNKCLNAILSYSFDTDKKYLESISQISPNVFTNLLMDYFFRVSLIKSGLPTRLINNYYYHPQSFWKEGHSNSAQSFVKFNSFLNSSALTIDKINFCLPLYESVVDNIDTAEKVKNSDYELDTTTKEAFIIYLLENLLEQNNENIANLLDKLFIQASNSSPSDFAIKSSIYSKNEILIELIANVCIVGRDYNFLFQENSIAIVSLALDRLDEKGFAKLEEEIALGLIKPHLWFEELMPVLMEKKKLQLSVSVPSISSPNYKNKI